MGTPYITAKNFVVKNDTSFRIDFEVTSGEARIQSITGCGAVDDYNYLFVSDPTGKRREFYFDVSILRKSITSTSVINVMIRILDVDNHIFEWGFCRNLAVENGLPYVGNLNIYQRKDGSRLVDICYDYLSPKEIDPAIVSVSLTNKDEILSIPEGTILGDIGSMVSVGANKKIIWNPGLNFQNIPICAVLSLVNSEGKVATGNLTTGSIVLATTYPIGSEGLLVSRHLKRGTRDLSSNVFIPQMSVVLQQSTKKFGICNGNVYKNKSIEIVREDAPFSVLPLSSESSLDTSSSSILSSLSSSQSSLSNSSSNSFSDDTSVLVNSSSNLLSMSSDPSSLTSESSVYSNSSNGQTSLSSAGTSLSSDLSSVSSSSDLSSGSSSSQSDQPLPEGQTSVAVIASLQDYPGTENDLSSDMHTNMDRLGTILSNKYAFNVVRMKDSAVTKTALRNAIIQATTGMQAGDAFVLAYAGHGSRRIEVPVYEDDGLDEALYLYDGAWYDDDIRILLDSLPAGIKITCIFESCYSGTATREFKVKPRDIPEESMREVLFTSSMEGELSWPEYFTKRGYFSNALISALNVSGNAVTSATLYNRILGRLGTNKQHPQLEGPAALKNARAFV